MWSAIIDHIPGWKIWMQALCMMLIAIIVSTLYNRLFNWGKANSLNKQQHKDIEAEQLTGDIELDLNKLKSDLEKNGDVHFREFRTSLRGSRAAIIFVEGMQDEALINRQVMQALMEIKTQSSEAYMAQGDGKPFAAYIKEKLLPVSKIDEVTDLYNLEQSILIGFTALLVDGLPHALLVGEPKPNVRSIDEPISESLLRGPRVGFTEVLGENTSMLRQQGLTTDLVLKMVKVGSRIEQSVCRLVICLFYLQARH